MRNLARSVKNFLLSLILVVFNSIRKRYMYFTHSFDGVIADLKIFSVE